MNTTENAPKAVKKDKAVILDSVIIKDYRQMVKNSLADHWGFITNTEAKRVDGSASVRIIKASQVEGFGIALKVKNLIGAEKQTISTILKTSMRAKRLDGVDAVDSLLDGIKSWVGFLDRLENAEAEKADAKDAEAEATAEAEAETKKELDLKGITPDSFAELTLKYFATLSMADAKIVNAKMADTCASGWNTIAKNSKAQVKANA